ncbi:unnamed protein product [Periconia digitata]|uniref:DRBM domain-containing protein n=1 Tax=Periconia digitata TaxID=1303443 RepID=A0A9W4UE46_9PLEO|nr:unnamed protein product [Periconia digitata]
MSAKKYQFPSFGRTRRHSKDAAAQMIGTTVGSESTSDIGVLDMDIELFQKDFDRWYAKVVFQYYLAMAIQIEHMEPRSISLKCIVEQVEASYQGYPSHNEGEDVNPSYPGSQLFKRIKAARSTKDEKTLRVFLDILNDKISQSCRKSRHEKVAELAANSNEGIQLTPEHTGRATTPSSILTNEQSAEDTSKEMGTPTPMDSFSFDRVEQKTNLPAPSNLPLHRYTIAIYEHATANGRETCFEEVQLPDDKWQCKFYYSGIDELGEAPSKQTAKHIACQKLCRRLRICG